MIAINAENTHGRNAHGHNSTYFLEFLKHFLFILYHVCIPNSFLSLINLTFFNWSLIEDFFIFFDIFFRKKNLKNIDFRKKLNMINFISLNCFG